MSGYPEGPKLVGYAVLPPEPARGTVVYPDQQTAELLAGFRAPFVQPVYTLPPLLWIGPVRSENPSLRQKLAWAFTGAVLMGLACLGAVVAGGAV